MKLKIKIKMKGFAYVKKRAWVNRCLLEKQKD